MSIEIEKDKADAARRKAEGVRDSTKYETDGEAYKQRETGKGVADAYDAQAKVIGPDKLAIIKVINEIATGNIKIVPDFLVTGDTQGGNLFNTWIATMLADRSNKKIENETK